MIKPQRIMFLAHAREHSHLEIFMGVRGQATLASATVFFALIRKIAFARMTGDWAKECKLAFQIARCSLLTVLLPSGGNCHRLHSRVRNSASALVCGILCRSDAETALHRNYGAATCRYVRWITFRVVLRLTSYPTMKANSARELRRSGKQTANLGPGRWKRDRA
jgi:hypothetical protein